MDKMGMKGRKWDIFISAVYMFAENGYDNVTMKDLAERNFIQAPAIYNHFKSKGSLLETMFEFYHTNWLADHPKLDNVMAAIPESSLDEIFAMLMYQFTEEIQPLMDRIMLVASRLTTADPGAYRLVREHIFQQPAKFLSSVFQELINCNRIKPFDIDSYVVIYANLAYGALIWNSTDDALNIDQWFNINKLLYSLIEPV